MMKSKGDANRKRRRAEGADADTLDSDAEDAASGEDSDVGTSLQALHGFACVHIVCTLPH